MIICYENGITGKFLSLKQFKAEITWLRRKSTDEFSHFNYHIDEQIKLVLFVRGPLFTLFVFYPIIILEFIFEKCDINIINSFNN